MASDVRQADDFIAYPTNRVVGTIANAVHARAAIEALLQAGFTKQDIDILQGEEDLHRNDAPGAEHRFLAQFQRTLIRTLADEYNHLRLGEEYKHLQQHVEDVRAGRSVIMVLARKRDRREAAASILCTHGAELIEFYGRWAYHALEPHPAVPLVTTPVDSERGDPTPGRTYAIDLNGTPVQVRLDSESRATILRSATGSPDLSHIPVTHLRPHLLMIAWQEADRTTHVHVYDFESGQAHAVVGHGERRVHHASGSVRRVDSPAAT